jgi:hypothetical protein
MKDKILEYCSICDAPLDADNCYGTDDYPLCREHHEKFYDAVDFMLTLSGHEKAAPVQLSLEI